MSIVKVEAFGAEELERANKVLAQIPDGAKRAIQSAMPRAVSHLRKKATERIRERYAISAGNVRANQNITVSYQAGNGMIAQVRFSGSKIPLFKFEGASPKGPSYDRSHLVPGMTGNGWKMVPTGKPASGHVLASTGPQLFAHAFVATMSNGHTGIFERNGKGISEIMGVSVAQMVGNEEVANKLIKDASEKFEERMEHEISRLLNGFG